MRVIWARVTPLLLCTSGIHTRGSASVFSALSVDAVICVSPKSNSRKQVSVMMTVCMFMCMCVCVCVRRARGKTFYDGITRFAGIIVLAHKRQRHFDGGLHVQLRECQLRRKGRKQDVAVSPKKSPSERDRAFNSSQNSPQCHPDP